jgi:DNA helicase-2/ATP-dependent DNA helicase PcrA
MINAKEYKKEVDYLKSVLYTLEKEIAKQSQEVGNLNSDLQEEMKYTWDPTNRLNDTEFTYAIADIHRRSYSRNIITSNIKSYKRMIKSAYFARFDFDDGEDVMPVYLGIATLQNDDYFYVYDWRAPICSMFYDYEIGEASYQTPSGEIVKGKITLKRQYKIEGDTIKEVFDTDMQVIDNILQQMLSEKTSNKMRNIVSTIQKEQNKIIRKNDVDIMVVSGPAGSGKTSVAMHKIAYLLYSKRDKLSNSEILILSPNEIFSNYISNVLPQIGEDNVYQTTFMDYVNMFLTEYKIHGSLNDIYEKYYASTKPTVRYNSIKLKFSSAYINLIETYLARNRDEILGIKDIMIDGKLVMDKEFLSKLAAELDGCGLSYVEQSKKLMEKVVLHTTIKAQKTQNMSAKLKKYLQNDKIRPKDVYNKLYSDRDKFVHLVEDIYNTAGTSKADRLTIKELVDIFNYTASNLSKG